MLTGVLKPTRGEILCHGVVPFKNRKRYVKSIGVVFGQRSQLWWDLPVIESFKLFKAVYEIGPDVYQENLDFFKQIVNLDKLFLIPVRNLSLGQRMICDIAASFLHNPEIIFMAVRSKVREIIGKLNTLKRTTILITSHDTADVETLCRRVILIDKRKLLFDGELRRFNRLFGAYRTLKLDLGVLEEDAMSSIATRLRERFPAAESVQMRKEESGLGGSGREPGAGAPRKK
jgi:ABC-2 type transport system ATP-binding protein